MMADWHVRAVWVGGVGVVIGAAVAAGSSGQASDPWSEAIEAATREHRVGLSEETIGRSIEARAIRAFRVRGEGAGEGARRPTVVVIAGLDPRHAAGSKVAIGVLARVLADRPAGLAHADLVVIPCVNPDGANRWLAGGPRADQVGNNSRRQTAREDADRDRRIDEDGPVDLNGDGVISQMRVRRPRAGMIKGLVATEVSEADETRLMRRADATKGEQGEWAVLVEGRDHDGDGSIAENPATGVDLDGNFPYHWREFEGTAGPTPLSEPESRALAEWLLAHQEVVAVLVYGPKDNLIGVPEAGKMDATGQAPISGGILDEDKPLYEWASKTFKDATGTTGSGGVTGGFDGSLQGWAYAQLGVASFVTPGWVRPDLAKRDEPKPPAAEDPELETEPLPEKKMPDTDDGKWLALSDRRVSAGLAAGFLDWKPFEHPQLGPVEIGGWAPGFRLDAPDAELARAQQDHSAFVAGLLAAAPRLVVDPARVERVGERAWKISASATNAGTMATRTAMGVRARRHPPTRWEIELPAERLLAGRKSQGAASVGPGNSVIAEWVVIGDAGGAVSVKLLSPECGDQSLQVELKVDAANEGRQP